MQRARTKMLKRPQNVASRVARNSKEAAIDLVRIEFDVNRLSMGIRQAEDRIQTYSAELEIKLQARQKLLNMMQR